MNQDTINPVIEPTWQAALQSEFSSPYFTELVKFLKLQKSSKKVIYPPGKKIFAAFDKTPLDKVKAVIIGQDPYHGPGQANGLCFSVSDGIKQPPSLKNIFKELAQDLNCPAPTSGNLERWADQGVLMLNATLTVEHSAAGSHQGKGWEQFTDAVIRTVSDKLENVVFILWGRFAQNKASLVDIKKHHILKAAHPSPFSAHSGFFGCKHFSKTNEFLHSKKLEVIDWSLQ